MGRDVAKEVASGVFPKTLDEIQYVATHCGVYSDLEEMEFADFENFYEEEAVSLIKKKEIEQ